MKAKPRVRPLSYAVLLAFALGCSSASSEPSAGAHGGSSNGSSGAGATPGEVPVSANPGGATVSCDPTARPGVSPLLRLSTLQYRNTVKDLLEAVGASAVLPSV